jgi:sodium pump decarboxylase gamma subunit
MLAVMFSLAGCDNDIEKPFDYDDAQIIEDTMGYFVTYSNVSDEYASYYLSDGTEFEQSAIKGIKQAVDTDKVGKFEDFSAYDSLIDEGQFDTSLVSGSIENSTDSVSVTVINKAENRDVEITIKYVENADYYMQLDKAMQSALEYYTSMGYTEADILSESGYSTLAEAFGVDEYLQSYGVYPYTPEEMVVSAVYSKGELMKQAGMNTIIGMATVFVVLIFISFIISLFKFLPALLAKKPKLPEPQKEAPAPVKPQAATATAKTKNLMDDTELVAVITAAVYAAEGSVPCGATSRDKLVVRSIKRAKK